MTKKLKVPSSCIQEISKPQLHGRSANVAKAGCTVHSAPWNLLAISTCTAARFNPGRWNSSRTWMLKAGFSLLLAISIARNVLAADTNSDLLDKIPPLKPPRGEMPPTFWEQHGLAVTLSAIGAVLVLAVVVSFVTRPKPTAPVPPIILAREALNSLRSRTEDGVILSRVSQILRRYIAAEFSLGPDELTTTEFARLLAGNEKVGPELGGRLTSFLRDCDERKFSASRPEAPLNAISTAAQLLNLAEFRKKQLLAAEASKDANLN